MAQTISRSEIEKRFDELLSSNGPALLGLARSYTNSTSDRDDQAAASFLYTIGMVGFTLFVQHWKRRKTQTELNIF